MLQNFYEPGERASSDPSIFTFSSASGERVCDLWLINERAKPLARSAHCQPWYESRRLSSYLFKVNIGHTVVQLEDGRTDGRNTSSCLKSYDETRQHRKISVSVRPMSSYGRTIANPAYK